MSDIREEWQDILAGCADADPRTGTGWRTLEDWFRERGDVRTVAVSMVRGAGISPMLHTGIDNRPMFSWPFAMLPDFLAAQLRAEPMIEAIHYRPPRAPYPNRYAAYDCLIAHFVDAFHRGHVPAAVLAANGWPVPQAVVDEERILAIVNDAVRAELERLIPQSGVTSIDVTSGIAAEGANADVYSSAVTVPVGRQGELRRRYEAGERLTNEEIEELTGLTFGFAPDDPPF